MAWQIGGYRDIALVTLVVLVVIIIASVGFQTVTDNPLMPDATLNATDADERSNASRSDPVRWFVVEHTGGEPIKMSEVEIVLWQRDDGVVLNQTNSWTEVFNGFRYRSRSTDGTALPTNFQSGDRLVVTYNRVDGPTSREEATYWVRVRVFHKPSQRVILDQQVRTVVGA